MRMHRILEIVHRLASHGAPQGVTTEEVARTAGVLRHNASADLNELFRKGFVLKGNGRPVRFRTSESAVAELERSGVSYKLDNNLAVGTEAFCFHNMIGAQGSLRTAVEQARAAMFYPPRGLPTLIVGQTGAGKSYLAEIMYHFAIQSGPLNSGAPFVVFNCADYAANPQLLLAQLFGYVKGAFTGAEHTTPGLIAQAEKGVLFLDEIHRLPPEGQEMLFLLMDRGIYRMLGDGVVHRPAFVTLIAATSEDPYSALLATLLRRFPVVITLPDLSGRSLEERLALIEQFLREEAARVGVPISVSPLVLVALLSFRTVGNVGELRSAILLGCAKAFLNYISTGRQSGMMLLYLTHLAPAIQLDYLQSHLDTIKAEQLVGVEERIYSSARDLKTKENQDVASLDLYGELSRRVGGYIESNLEPSEVQKLIRIDVDYYLRRLMGKPSSTSLLPIGFLDVVADFTKEAGKQLGYEFGPEVITGLALHFASTPRSDHANMDRTMAMLTHCPREYGVVRRLAEHLETRLDTTLTPGEISFLALFLAAHRRTVESANLIILVIAHGERTASSMAEVANQLLGEKRVLAVDMPLAQSVEDTLQRAIQRIKETGKSKGALLLVDMGSLTGFGPALEHATDIPVAVISLVTTAAVIEAARLANGGDMDLATVAQAVKHVYNLDASPPLHQEGKRVIITTCLTGQGTARKLAAFITEALPEELRSHVLVQPVDLENGSDFPGLLVEGWRGTVIAAVGTVDPHLPGVSFIGMEQILFGKGMHTLVTLAMNGDEDQDSSELLTREEAVVLASRFVEDYISFPDGKRFAEAAATALDKLEERLGWIVSASQAARWVIHLAFALERLSTDGLVLDCNEMTDLEEHHGFLLEMINLAVTPVAEAWHIALPRGEIGYLALIVVSA
ncbi:MAG: sigma 54-interacting transcriptional regulator [Desulfitobacteriaceae bacterium]